MTSKAESLRTFQQKNSLRLDADHYPAHLSTNLSYAGFLVDVIARNPNNKAVKDLVPQAAIEAFEKLKEWE